MLYLYRYLRPLVQDEKGQTMIEYALMVVLIALGVVIVFPTVAASVVAAFTDIDTQLDTRPAAP